LQIGDGAIDVADVLVEQDGDLVTWCGALTMQVEYVFDLGQCESKGSGTKNESQDRDIVVAE
jgi:hypothetical protein